MADQQTVLSAPTSSQILGAVSNERAAPQVATQQRCSPAISANIDSQTTPEHHTFLAALPSASIPDRPIYLSSNTPVASQVPAQQLHSPPVPNNLILELTSGHRVQLAAAPRDEVRDKELVADLREKELAKGTSDEEVEPDLSDGELEAELPNIFCRYYTSHRLPAQPN
jgi:hypothetical protein